MLRCVRGRGATEGGLLSCKTPRPSSSTRPSTSTYPVGMGAGAGTSSETAARSGFCIGSNSVTSRLHERGYTLGKSIGEGSYCKVKIAYKTNAEGETQKIACKIIDKRKASNDFVSKFLPRELSVVRGLRHLNIVTVLDVLDMPRHVYMFMDLCERGDLLEYIRTRGALSEVRSRYFFRQIVSAVEHLHALDIAHRDLKCENVLLSTKDVVKIADFGFARWCHDENGRRILSTTFCGSAAYAAPEILQGVAYNPKMYDSWSLGCVLFIMLTASMPFDDSNIPSMVRAQSNRLINFPGGIEVNTAARQLILHLLEPDVTRRATMRQVARSNWLSHPTFTLSSNPVTRPIHSLPK